MNKRAMEAPRKGSFFFSRGKRLLALILVLVSLLQLFPMTAWAAWDGSGDSGGNAGAVTGDFKIYASDESNIVGYRFSIYDEAGEKMGHSVDYDMSQSYAAYRYYYTKSSDGTKDKKSHIDLYEDYLAYTKNPSLSVSLGTKHQVARSSSSVGPKDYTTYYIYGNTDLANYAPSEIGTWLEAGNADEVAKDCGASDFNADTDYVIVEPLFLACIEGTNYVLTVAELAVYQSISVAGARANAGYSDTDGWNYVEPVSTSANPYLAYIGRFTSGVFLRYLYAEKEYTGIFDTKPVTSSLQYTSVDGYTFMLPGYYKASSTGGVFNTAASILKYQVGMGVYTLAPESSTYTVNHYLMNANGTYPTTPTKTETGKGAVGSGFGFKQKIQKFSKLVLYKCEQMYYNPITTSGGRHNIRLRGSLICKGSEVFFVWNYEWMNWIREI